MSKGEILEHKGEGLYRVRQKLAVERIQQELTQVQARLAELAVELPTAKLELIHADDAVRDKAQEIEQLIPDYAAGTDGALQKITALQTELIRLQSEAGQLRLKVADLIAEDLANRKRQNQLEQVPEGREMDLWCADYSVELTGEVGLVDINDEGGQGALIQPGFEDGAVYDAARDGALFPNLAQSGPQIYLNAALLPGVQKWRPRYRIGTITKLNGDVCDVDLDPAQSSAQNLNINQAETLQQVPIKYMDCDGFAFEESDRVLVRFTKSGPLVVGFFENPKDCGAPKIAATPMLSTGNFWTGQYFGPRFEDDSGNPINPPLGEPGADLPAWVFKVAGGQLASYTRGMPATYGLRNWVGEKESDILSWHGPSSRICWLLRSALDDMDPMFPPFGSTVFYKSKVICDLLDMPIGSTYKSVDGAAIVYKGDAGDRYLRVCASNAVDHYPGNWLNLLYRIAIIDIPWSGPTPDIGNAQVLSTYTHYIAAAPVTGMYFSPSGAQGTLCLSRDNSKLHKIRVEINQYGSIRINDYQIENPVIGPRSGTTTRSVSDDIVNKTGTSTSSGTIAENRKVIGFEYVGETETPVEVVDAEQVVYSYLRVSGPYTGEIVETASRGPSKIVFGGKTLIETEMGLSRSQTVTGNRDYSTRTFNQSYEYIDQQGLIIDARLGFVAATIVTSHIGASSISKTMSLSVNLKGSEIGRISQTKSEPRGPSGNDPRFFRIGGVSGTFDFKPTYGQGGPVITFPTINRPSIRPVRQGSFAAVGGAFIGSFEWQPRFDTGVDGMGYVQRLSISSGGDPASEFMDRNSEDGYLLTNVGII